MDAACGRRVWPSKPPLGGSGLFLFPPERLCFSTLDPLNWSGDLWSQARCRSGELSTVGEQRRGSSEQRGAGSSGTGGGGGTRGCRRGLTRELLRPQAVNTFLLSESPSFRVGDGNWTDRKGKIVPVRNVPFCTHFPAEHNFHFCSPFTWRHQKSLRKIFNPKPVIV